MKATIITATLAVPLAAGLAVCDSHPFHQAATAHLARRRPLSQAALAMPCDLRGTEIVARDVLSSLADRDQQLQPIGCPSTRRQSSWPPVSWAKDRKDPK